MPIQNNVLSQRVNIAFTLHGNILWLPVNTSGNVLLHLSTIRILQDLDPADLFQPTRVFNHNGLKYGTFAKF